MLRNGGPEKYYAEKGFKSLTLNDYKYLSKEFGYKRAPLKAGFMHPKYPGNNGEKKTLADRVKSEVEVFCRETDRSPYLEAAKGMGAEAENRFNISVVSWLIASDNFRGHILIENVMASVNAISAAKVSDSSVSEILDSSYGLDSDFLFQYWGYILSKTLGETNDVATVLEGLRDLLNDGNSFRKGSKVNSRRAKNLLNKADPLRLSMMHTGKTLQQILV